MISSYGVCSHLNEMQIKKLPSTMTAFSIPLVFQHTDIYFWSLQFFHTTLSDSHRSELQGILQWLIKV